MVWRVAVGGFDHETHTCATSRTTHDSCFRHDGRPELIRGPALIEAVQGTNAAIEGFLQAAVACEHAVEALPLVWCSADSAGPVESIAFDEFTSSLCGELKECLAAGPLHGVYLDLHGPMLAEGCLDGKVEVIRRVRAIAGQTPVVCSLDWCANISEELVALTDALTVQRLWPCADSAESGARALTLLTAVMSGARVQKDFRDGPMMIPFHARNAAESLVNKMQALATMQDILGVDFAAGFPSADYPCCHPSVVAYGVDATAVEEVVELMEAAVYGREAIPDFTNPGPEAAYGNLMPGLHPSPKGATFAGQAAGLPSRKRASETVPEDCGRPEFILVETIDWSAEEAW